MKSTEIRKRFLSFFEKHEHIVLNSASLVPENDPSVLFTTAGVQPIIPYILQGSHPQGTRLASIQKCVRTTDIDDVGDKAHATFFEMMGNWSIGDYFKNDAIQWSWELLTSKDEGFGLDPMRLYVTVFEGDENAPKDELSHSLWTKLFTDAGLNASGHIFYMSAKTNWWPQPKAGDTASGPTGPDTEMFYDVTSDGLGDLTKESYIEADDRQEVTEIWNDVFMEFKKESGKIAGKLEKQNVDTGSGFERMLMVLQGKDSIYDTDVLSPLLNEAKKISTDIRSQRIIADHIRTATFLIADGVRPSNTDRGYVLRRLLRRAVMHATDKTLSLATISTLTNLVAEIYESAYPEVKKQIETIQQEINAEVLKFGKTLLQGIKQFEKISHSNISGKDAFVLFSSYGFPLEITKELAKEKGIEVDEVSFNEELSIHQEKSRTAAAGKFKGGLAGHGEMETKYHTATHLLNAALRKVLGDHVGQKGSNINSERLRFDFSHGEKLTPEQKEQVANDVNEAIKADLPVSYTEMPLEEARTLGAVGVFGEKYPDIVKVYTIGDSVKPWSREICGGPHVEHTGVLGTFKIAKEEAVSQGVRRIKAVLE
jgi:alanyl-tRNA synthetase